MSKKVPNWECLFVNPEKRTIGMVISSRLPLCAGQAADAVSAYTKVKMEDAQNYL